MKDTTELSEERTRLSSERTRLAHERTFLSWIRTGLASVGGGIAVARLLLFQNVVHQQIATLCGQALVIGGILIFIFALIDYRKNYKKLQSKRTHAGSLVAITTVVLTLIVISTLLFIIVFNLL